MPPIWPKFLLDMKLLRRSKISILAGFFEARDVSIFDSVTVLFASRLFENTEEITREQNAFKPKVHFLEASKSSLLVLFLKCQILFRLY